MAKKKAGILIILFISVLAFYAVRINYNSRGFVNALINKIQGKTLNAEFQIKIKSGNLSTDYNIDQVLNDIEELRLNTLNVPIVINIDSRTSSNMVVDENSKKRAIDLVKKLKGKKVNIILEAYPWIENGSIGETAWNPDNIDNFFYNWKHNVLKVLIDEVAVPYHVDALSIGTSFVNMESQEEDMCDLVDYVRTYYKGLVTYRTNFWITAVWKPELTKEYEKKLNNLVFSKLDFISIAAYFELTNNDTNTIDNLVSSLYSTQIYDRKQNVVQEIKGFYDKWDKLIFFGELGFPKTNKASIHPYDPYLSDIMNNLEQANCFEAYRKVFESCSWNLGFSIFAIGETSAEKRYYPSKESVEIIKRWYTSSDN
ncbi:glycoside hydrolase family 113 [Clostridium cellulovorans]|nr:hydrolase [Clostridium cellulovorans]